MLNEFIGIFWIIPYVLMLYLIGWVNHFHLIIIIPILCISIAKMIYDMPSIMRIKRGNIMISSAVIAAIVLFGIISTSILISTNLSYVQLKTASYISNAIISNDSNTSGNKNKDRTSFDTNNARAKITVISGPIYSWIFKYVFDNHYAFSHLRDTQPLKTEKIILLVDPLYKRIVSKNESENQTQAARLGNIYNNSYLAALFGKLPANYTKKVYPFTGIDSADSGLTTSEIRKNY